MLGQLRENQHAMIQYLPQLAIESPVPPQALETPKRPTLPKQPRTLDLDKLHDKQSQQTYDLPSANEFLQMSNQRLEILYDKVTKIQKSVGGRKSATKSDEKRESLDKDSDTLKKYNKILDTTLTTNLSKTIGNGFGQQRKRNAYKL